MNLELGCHYNPLRKTGWAGFNSLCALQCDFTEGESEITLQCDFTEGKSGITLQCDFTEGKSGITLESTEIT